MAKNIEAEQAVLGTIMLDDTIFETLKLQPTHFNTAAHQIIFNAMNELNLKGLPIDPVGLQSELGEQLEQVGNFSYLVGLTEHGISVESIHAHQRYILESYQSRIFKEISLKNANESDHEKINETIKELQALNDLAIVDTGYTFQEMLKQIAYEIGDVKDISQMAYQTNFTSYDKLTGGLQKSDLIIVAARPSIGKTAFGLNMGVQHCINGGTTHIFTLEMPAKRLIQRLINMTGKISSTAWHAPVFSLADYNKAINAIGVMGEWDMNIYDKIKSMSDIRAIMRKEVQQNPNKRHLVIIDYLGRLTTRGGDDRHDIKVGENVNGAKDMAETHDIPVVLLSQINRGVEQRQDKRPVLSDLKDTGDAEQTADVVAFLYRDDYYEDEQTNTIEILIRKQRDGPTGDIELAFSKEYGLFLNLDKTYAGGQSND